MSGGSSSLWFVLTVLLAACGAALSLAGVSGKLAGRVSAPISRRLNALGYALSGVSLALFVLRGLGA